ncbi:MAG: NAD(P)-binding domain-containing protein, partial [Rhodospirillaceae bacterium]
MRIYTNDDVNPKTFQTERVAIIGYGSQGRAHALNLRDSGIDVVVGVRPGGAGWTKAAADGLRAATPEEAAKNATLIALLTPDMSHETLWRDSLAPNVKAGAAVLFAHGFSVHYQRVAVPEHLDVILVAPKGPGDLVRREYAQGRGVPCLFAVH